MAQYLSAGGRLKPGLRAAVGLSTLSTVTTYVVTFVRSIVIARLLTPEAYGLYGLAATVFAAVSALTSLNLEAVAVQRKVNSTDELERVANTVWTLEVIRSVLSSLLLLVLAYPSAVVLNDRRVFLILLITAVTPVLNGVGNIGLALARRDMDFRPIVAYEMVTLVATSALAVVAAWATRDVWALVITQLVGAILGSAISYWVHPHRPRVILDKTVARESLVFGSHLLVVGTMTYVTTQFDNLVVGRSLGAATLGAYLLAYRLASLPSDIMSQVLGNALFPAYARLHRTQPSLLPRVFADTFGVTVSCLVAMAGALSLGGEGVVRLLYGAKWRAAGELVTVLAFVGLLRGCARAVAPVFVATGRVWVESFCKVMEALVFVPCVLAMVSRWGAVGAAYAGILSYAVAFLGRYVITIAVFTSERRAVLGSGMANCMGALLAGALTLVAVPAEGSWLVRVLVFEVVFLILVGSLLAPLRMQALRVLASGARRFRGARRRSHIW